MDAPKICTAKPCILDALVIQLPSSSRACQKQEKTPSDKATADTGEDVTTQDSSAETTEINGDEPEFEGAAYGYGGTDPVEVAVYKYIVEELSKHYGEAEVNIPTVSIVAVDDSKADEVIVYGDFWIENYNIDGDTLKCVSGGNYPGVMHLKKDGDKYEVSKMDMVPDGSDFDGGAKKLFGTYYEDFMKVYSDQDARDELRKITVSDYVNLNGLSVTQYQDEGWDPVELYH